MKLTKAQERRLEHFRRLAEKELEHMQNGEIKNWEVKQCGRSINLRFSIGRVGDENIWKGAELYYFEVWEYDEKIGEYAPTGREIGLTRDEVRRHTHGKALLAELDKEDDDE